MRNKDNMDSPAKQIEAYKAEIDRLSNIITRLETEYLSLLEYAGRRERAPGGLLAMPLKLQELQELRELRQDLSKTLHQLVLDQHSGLC